MADENFPHEIAATIEEVRPPEYQSFGHYQMGDKGLIHIEVKEGKGSEPETKETWLSSPFEVLANTRDKSSEAWGKLLRWRDPDGRKHEWAMPAAMLGGSKEDIWRELLSGGLRIASSQAARNKLSDYLASVHVPGRGRAVERVGWHTGASGMAFVLPDHVIGETGERILLQTEARIEAPYNVAGTAEKWREEVGRLCIGNSRLILSVSLAFAPPLLLLAKEEGGGFNWYGPSRAGKTTLLHAAGSVWGGGRVNGFLDTWKATANGLEGVAAGHCDALLSLDEMGQVPRPEEVGETAYMLANGSGKARASRSGAVRRRAEWRLLFLSSGEITLADKMAEAGKRPRAGQEVRLVDIPADSGTGLGVFEELHGSPKAGVFAERIKQATERCYGAPIRRYLELLTDLAKDPAFADSLRRGREDFLAANLPAGASGQVRSVCARFALAAIGGSLATEFGLTGWPKDKAETAAARCFEDWLAKRGSAGNSEIDTGIRQVIAFIEAHGASRFEAAWVDNPERILNRVGFRKWEGAGETGLWRYMILPEAWRSELCKGFDAAALAREMVRRKLLVPGDGDHLAKRTPVPGYGSPRLYCLAPGILSDESADNPKSTGNAGKSGNPKSNARVSNGLDDGTAVPTAAEALGTLGTAPDDGAAGSQRSQLLGTGGNPKNPSISAPVPSVPSIPTQNGINATSSPPREREPGEDEDPDAAPPWFDDVPDSPDEAGVVRRREL